MKRSAPDITTPLILTGTGRCGSTFLHEILSHHPGLTWLTPLTHVFPRQPWITRFQMRVLDVRTPSSDKRGAFLRRFVRPSEAYPFWNAYCTNFGPTPRDLDASDLDGRCAEIRGAFARMLTPTRSRLLLKLTGWPRVGLLRAMFPDARFVHIRRDGRAVANSWLNVDWAGLDADHTRPDGKDWRWGPLSADQTARYEASGLSPVALAAIAWEILMDAHAASLDESALQLTYEELCARPVEVVHRITEFADIPFPSAFERSVASTDVRDNNDLWRKTLDNDQQRILQETIAPALARHGYA